MLLKEIGHPFVEQLLTVDKKLMIMFHNGLILITVIKV